MEESSHTRGKVGEETFTRGRRVITREIAGETLLVPIRGNLADMQRLFALNPVGAFIWEKMDGKRTLAEIAEELAGAFDVEEDKARKDLEDFVSRLSDAGLIKGVKY